MPKKYCLLFAAITAIFFSACDKKTEIPENVRRLNEIDSLSKIIDGYNKYDFKYSLQLTGDAIPRVIIPDSMDYFQNFKNWDNYKGSMTNIYTIYLLLKLQKYCLEKYGRDDFDLFEMFNTSENEEFFLLNYLEIARISVYAGYTLSEISQEAIYHTGKLIYQETEKHYWEMIWDNDKMMDLYDETSQYDKFLFLINQEIKWMIQDIMRLKKKNNLNMERQNHQIDKNKYEASYIKVKDFVNNFKAKFTDFPDWEEYKGHGLRTIRFKSSDITSKDILKSYFYNSDSTMRYLMLLDYKGLLKMTKYLPGHQERFAQFDSSCQRKMIEILALDYMGDFKRKSAARETHSWLIMVFNYIYWEYFRNDKEISRYDQQIMDFPNLWYGYTNEEIQPKGWPSLEELRRKVDSLDIRIDM